MHVAILACDVFLFHARTIDIYVLVAIPAAQYERHVFVGYFVGGCVLRCEVHHVSVAVVGQHHPLLAVLRPEWRFELPCVGAPLYAVKVRVLCGLRIQKMARAKRLSV